MTSHQGPVILYDGSCGFCDLMVRSLLHFDRRKIFLFAPLQGDFARRVIAVHESLRDVDSLVLVEAFHGAGKITVSVRSAALLGIARQLGGAWRGILLLGLIPRGLLDRRYDMLAQNRYRLFSRHTKCRNPPSESRSRFLG